jgi:hypothetical protein
MGSHLLLVTILHRPPGDFLPEFCGWRVNAGEIGIAGRRLVRERGWRELLQPEI